MSCTPTANTLFTSTKLGLFRLQHQIVISPPSHTSMVSVEEFYRTCTTEGGLVIVPYDTNASIQRNIAEIIHTAKGIAFCL
ncbi:hypothetical protein HHX47_DHR6000155, partial [Lentinula edodes]